MKHRLPGIKTLAMLKMEKNFIAVIEKNCPRQPYADESQSIEVLIDHIDKELEELFNAWFADDVPGMKEECADISNLVDYLFEKLCTKPPEGTKTE